jgi:hypothetical protein
VNALASKEVGDYLDKHFVCSFQKIGSFRLVNGAKQGGNVASYFCTPSGNVLDAIAGPVDADTMLREARWVVETRKMALLASGSDLNRYKLCFRLAHAEQLQNVPSLARVDWRRLPFYKASAPALASVLQNPAAWGLSKQDRVHLFLAAFPLVKLDQAYQVIYEKILGENISTLPVKETGTAPPATWGPQVRVNGKTASLETLANCSHAFPSFGAPADSPAPRSRQQAQAMALNHARHDPPLTEICSGRTLNILLADLKDRGTQKVEQQPVTIDRDVLKHINLTSDRRGASIGPLKDGGRLRWPLAWEEPGIARKSAGLRKAMASALQSAVAQVKESRNVGPILVGLRGDVRVLGKLLKKHVDDLEPSEYVEAKNYLADLDAALKVLGRPDAVQYLDGSFAPDPRRTKTVGDLVKFMADKGLRFAPAEPGEEAAYMALQRALAGADNSGPALASADQGDL